jgi:DHA1 family multidrug resistance protein-like MFS transporter
MSLKITNKGIFFVAISQFGMAFSMHCVMAFMPFYILRMSPFGPKETMIWIGMIMGVSNVVSSFTASFWGGLTSRFSPKLLLERGLLSNGIMILLMGFTNNLYALLLLRIIQGAVGGVSTIGLILISSSSQGERLHKDLSLFQNSITMGHLLGPPIGAYMASLFGYRAPFIFAFIIVSIFLIFCHLYVNDIPLQKKRFNPDVTFKKGLLLGWMLCFITTLHLTFLPSILPNILEGFQLVGDTALKSAGFIIMSYTGAAILGNYLLSRLASKIGLKKVITIACLSAAFFQVLLIVSQGVLSFTVIRMIQVAFITGVIPLTFSLFARDVGGGMMGFLNSSRFVGSAIGPLMATSVLAYYNLLTLYILIVGFTLSALWAFLTFTKTEKS